jgi:response regulator NasT
MDKQLRIGVADDDAVLRNLLKEMLTRAGYQTVFAVDNGRALVSQCQAHRPDVVIADINMPDLDGLDAAAAIYQDAPVPIILVSAYHTPEMLERAGTDHVLSYLVKPILAADLQPAIAIARRRFEQFQALRQEVTDLHHGLHERHLIEAAKGILMRESGLDDEHAAFLRLQQMAKEEHKPLPEMAQTMMSATAARNVK